MNIQRDVVIIDLANPAVNSDYLVGLALVICFEHGINFLELANDFIRCNTVEQIAVVLHRRLYKYTAVRNGFSLN